VSAAENWPTVTAATFHLDRRILHHGACALCSTCEVIVSHPSHACPLLREEEL
jgi:hypothetical protein